MLAPHDLAAMFRSGDLTEGPIRPRYIAQNFVVMRCSKDPLRAVQVYRDLLGPSGSGRHAAERFLGLLEAAQQRPFALWWHEVLAKRKVLPLPA